MTIATRQTAALPRICAIGSSFVRLLPGIIPSYAHLADIRIIDKIFEEGLEAAEDLVKTGHVDVFVSAGANGAFLRNHLDAPVALLKIGGFDILHALAKARDVSPRIAIFSYQAISSDLEEVKQLLKVDVEQCFYTTPEDAKDRVRELAAQGLKVIVGSNMISRLAREAGLAGIFLYSVNSARELLDNAIEIARVTRIEESRREWLNSMVQHLEEGVVAVDMEERIHCLNPTMAKLLGVSPANAIDRRLTEIAPGLGLEDTLRSGIPELQQAQRIGPKTIVTNRIPIKERGIQTGAVLSFHDAMAIHVADRNVRSHDKPRHLVAKYRLSEMVCHSPALTDAKTLAEEYAKVDAAVLITGESGTGKELLAQGIHNASRRANYAFVALNCPAFPESLLESELFGHEEGAFTGARRGGRPGLFEAAHNGTIFLDEIGDMSLALQTRLLRVLQEREVLRLGSSAPTPIDVRVIAATNRDLRREIVEGRFRQDLYYRLNILNLHVPPLRERPEDIPPIAAYLLDKALRRLGSAYPQDELLDYLLPRFTDYAWPGNVREMENVIERVAVHCLGIGARAGIDGAQLVKVVPEIFSVDPAQNGELEETQGLRAMSKDGERAYILKVIEECGGNHAQACKRLGIGRTTLWRKLAEKR